MTSQSILEWMDLSSQAVLTCPEVLPQLSGLYYFDDFVSEDEEQRLVHVIDSYPFCEVRVQLQKLSHFSAVFATV